MHVVKKISVVRNEYGQPIWTTTLIMTSQSLNLVHYIQIVFFSETLILFDSKDNEELGDKQNCHEIP